jgi:DNA-binding winged helix-turn-helix (wHTH) protein/TolB-like protein/tetratricopeptide (TPR) repeat protein
MSNARKELYEFDNFRLDVSERILWRAGERLPLSEKAFDTLRALVRRGNHLVGKDELLAEVWADAIVEENNLDKNISILRRVLGERAGKGKFIETVRGHGFRFVPTVQILVSEIQAPRPVETEILQHKLNNESETENPVLQNEPENTDFKLTNEFRSPTPKIRADQIQNPKSEIRNRWAYAFAALILLVGIGAAVYFWRQAPAKNAPVSSIKTITVLPFKPLVVENRDEALEMGMADTLISKLSGGDDIIVRPLSSVRRYAAPEQDSLTAANELETEAVLDGTIQTLGERVRISVRLLRTSDGKQLWAEQFDEKFTDIFAVQNLISEQVANALKIRLAGREKKRQTTNVEAYQFYMKGRFHLLKGVKPETETAVSYFRQAIELDPNYALAYAGLADAYRGYSVGGDMPADEFFPKAKAAANKAVELDDTLAEAHANLGHIMFWYDWDWPAAEIQHQRALELDPNSADALQFYAHLLSNTGRHAEALAKIKRAREIEPLNLRINALEGLFLLHAGQIDEAIDRLQKTLELEPNYRLANMFAARAYTEKGMYPEANAASRKAREISGGGTESVAFGVYPLVQSGKTAEAQAALDELLNLSNERYVPPYNLALVYNALGESEKALDYLERSFAEKDVRMVFLKVEPKWNNLRNEPRFITLMQRMNFE